jgi:hypothetical protein
MRLRAIWRGAPTSSIVRPAGACGQRPIAAAGISVQSHTQDDYARMLLARDQPGDKERALELLAEAVTAYQELGMESWAEAATRLQQPPRLTSTPGK